MPPPAAMNASESFIPDMTIPNMVPPCMIYCHLTGTAPLAAITSSPEALRVNSMKPATTAGGDPRVTKYDSRMSV